MKKLLVVMISLFSLNTFALEVEVVSAEFQVEDNEAQKSLCLTVVRIPESQELLGIVEDIQDCYYARTAKRAPHLPLKLDLNYLGPLEYGPLKQHLQRLDAQLEFYFSTGE